MSDAPAPRSRFTIVRRVAALIMSCAAGGLWLLLAAWLLGRILTDRIDWSQWLWWMPSWSALALAVAGLLLALRPDRRPSPRRRRRLGAWAAVAGLSLGQFALVEHRLLRRATPVPSGLAVVHWNLSERVAGREATIAGTITSLDADLTILSNAGAVPWDERIIGWLGDARPFRRGTFTVLTRLPVLESRWIIAEDGISVALLRVVPPDASDEQPLVIFLVDLPSDPRRGRMQIAERVRRQLDEQDAPAPDIVVGDLNITRGSASLRHLFPGLHHAFLDGGHGFAASFPRRFPLHHLDHILLAADQHCTRYDLPHVLVGRHRPQAAWIERRQSD